MLVFTFLKFFKCFFSGGKEVEDMEDELKDLLFGREENSNKDKKEKMEEEEEEEEVSKQTSLSVQSWALSVFFNFINDKKWFFLHFSSSYFDWELAF